LPLAVHRLEQAASFLSGDELERAEEYMHKEAKHRFILGRAMLRIIFARYSGLRASEVIFSCTSNMKPYVQGTNIQFNLSHSADLVLIALADTPVGVDVEIANNTFDFSCILPICFSVEEAGHIKFHGRPSFYQCWTRKEALLKASGIGLESYMQQLPCLDGTHKTAMDGIYQYKDWIVDSFRVNDGYASSIAYPAPTKKLVCFEPDVCMINRFIN